jgi:tetratricopeptide (TPR) repeat protein
MKTLWAVVVFSLAFLVLGCTTNSNTKKDTFVPGKIETKELHKDSPFQPESITNPRAKGPIDISIYEQAQREIQNLSETIRQQPDNFSALFQRAECYFAIDDLVHALADIDTILTNGQQFIPQEMAFFRAVYFGRYRILARMDGRSEEAFADLRRAELLDNGFMIILNYELGKYYYERGEAIRSLVYFEKVYEVDPDYLDVRFLLSMVRNQVEREK